MSSQSGGIPTFSPPGRVSAETLSVHASPSLSSNTIAHLIQRGDGSAWEYLLSTPDSLVTQFIEYGGEQAGVPIDSLAPSGTWARVVYATSIGGRIRLGWIQLTGPSHRRVMWADDIPKHPLFFRPPVTPAFHDHPSGKAIRDQLSKGDRNYIMHPIRIRGRWMLVRLVAPSDYCGNEGTVRGEFWIQYLDHRGRPTVWYYARGC